MIRSILALMILWDCTGHASQLVAGRDWSVGAPWWLQWSLCAVWFPSWTTYNLFWSLYWLAALALVLALRQRGRKSA